MQLGHNTYLACILGKDRLKHRFVSSSIVPYLRSLHLYSQLPGDLYPNSQHRNLVAERIPPENSWDLWMCLLLPFPCFLSSLVPFLNSQIWEIEDEIFREKREYVIWRLDVC